MSMCFSKEKYKKPVFNTYGTTGQEGASKFLTNDKGTERKQFKIIN